MSDKTGNRPPFTDGFDPAAFYDNMSKAMTAGAAMFADLAEQATQNTTPPIFTAAADLMSGMSDPDAQGSDGAQRRAKFFAEMLASAMSPQGFVSSNLEVLKDLVETNGENLAKGMNRFASDISNGRFCQADYSGFKLGSDIAPTPGKVIYRNELIELIQYQPTTPDVFTTPLLILPPWINKYYILDLNAEKSFVAWAVDRGLTVFIVSWVNPDETLRHKTFADYMNQGVFASLAAIEKATGHEQVNTIGYCLGGTLLAASLAFMAKKNDTRISSATFLASQVDFQDAGDLMIFTDEEQITLIEQTMEQHGFLPGSVMAAVFNLLRSKELIWNPAINNYLLGKEPVPFDLLCWNADSTNMCQTSHSFYLRQCYLENNLSTGRMLLDGERLDLSEISLPTYSLAAKDDHIAPLQSVFKLGHLIGGSTRQVVTGSGHVAGIINPPHTNKYGYWTNDSKTVNVKAWMENATAHQGSWWPDWTEWILGKSGKKIPTRIPGGGKLKVLEDAPGSYVKVKGA